MSSHTSSWSILRDPTLPWDQRCTADFTLCGRNLHHDFSLPTPGKIEESDEQIIKLYQSSGLSNREYLNINTRLQELYENPPASIEDRAKYLEEIQSLLLQLPKKMNTAQTNMIALANQLTEEKRKEYYDKLTNGWFVRLDKSLVGRPIRQAQKDLYLATIEYRTFLLGEMQRYSPDIPKELYMKIASSDLNEWEELLDKIYHPGTVDIVRQECFAQLKARKDYIDPALSEILKQADAKNEPIHESWREVQDVLDHDFSQAKFYTDPKDKNLAELSELFQSNPQLYGERSLLYEQKLISQGAHQEAIDYAIKWIKSLPQNASWEEVVQMSNLFMQTNGNSPHTEKFLNALNHWTEAQPNLRLNPEGYLSLQKEAEYLAITRGALYSATNKKLSFKAAECYQIWLKARPDDLTPKILLAYHHIDNAEWNKSQQIIAELPEEYAATLNKDRATRMFNVYSLPIDLAGMVILRSVVPFLRRKVLPGSLNDQALDVLSSTVQGASHQVLRRRWMPYCSKDLCPILEEPLSFRDKTSLGIFAFQIASPFVLPPIFEFFVPNLETRRTYLQPIVDFCNPTLSIASGGILTYEAYRLQASLTMPITLLASSIASLAGRLSLQHAKDLSPTKRAMIIIAIKVSTIGQDIGMLCASKIAITSIASYVVIRSRTQALCSTAGSFLASIPTTAGSPVLITASAISIIAYGLFIDFPKARTGALLDEANRRCHREKYTEANDLLKIAEKWFAAWSDQPIIRQYSGCITFLERSLKIENNEDHKRWLEKELLHVDKTIKVLEKSEYYASAKDDLHYHEIAAYLNTKQIDRAKEILNSIDVNSVVHGHTVLFVIEKAKEIASKDPGEVDTYLNEVIPIFQIPEYLKIVTKYQKYMACQRDAPILPENKTDENVLKRSQIISSLITLIKPRKILRQLEESLLFDALLLYVHTKDSKKAENLLNQISSAAHEQLAIVLIEQAIKCSMKNEFDKALDYLDRGIPLNGLASQPLLKAFKTYIELQKAQPLLTQNSSPDQINKRISTLDVILQNAGKIDISPFIQKEKLLFYVQVEQFQEAADWVTKQSIGADIQDAAISKIIQKAQQLSTQEALIYLTYAHDTLSRFENRDILKKIQNCLPNDPEKFASAETEISWAVAADDLITKISPLKSLASLHLFMKGFRCLVHIHRKEYAASSAIFQEIQLPEIFHAEAIMLIIKNSDKLGKEKGDIQELDYIKTACDSQHNLNHKEVLIFYRDMLACRKDRFASHEKEDQWLAAQVALIDKVKPIEALASLYSLLEDSTVIWYIQKRKYKQALEKLIVCSSTISAEITLQIIHQANQFSPEEARLYLEDAYANLEGFKYKEILQLYKDCLPQNDLEKNFPEEDARWVKAANDFIAAVEPFPDLSNLHLMMKGSKCIFHVAQKEYIAAASILGEGLLKNEFQAKVLKFIINEAHELSRKDQDPEASIYLEKAYEGMEKFTYKDILLKFKNYLARKKDCLSPESIVKWVDASETLIVSLQPIPQMLDVILQVRCRQFEVFLNHNKFYDIKHVLEQAEIPPVLRAELQKHLIGRLVSHFLKLEEFEQITSLLNISEHRLTKKYKVFRISLEQHRSDPISVLKIQESIQQLNALSNSLKTFNLSLPDWIIPIQADLHYSVGEHYWQMGKFRSSMEAFSQAEPLLAMQNLPETQRKLAYINILKEQALVFND